jgi:phytoene/squalene synthetase
MSAGDERAIYGAAHDPHGMKAEGRAGRAMPQYISIMGRSQTIEREERLPGRESRRARRLEPSTALPMRITRNASKQAYYTIRLLADRDRRLDAYRAYAYFRWVDDWLDQPALEQSERLAFVQRQRWLVDCGYRGGRPDDLIPQERIIADLIQSDVEEQSGLQSYIRNMMAVMAFDAERRWRLVTERELDQYTLDLATAVTDALHYFIGHERTPSDAPARYFPAIGAHITHMLRDTVEDLALGYFNIPSELLGSLGITPDDVESAAYRDWVKSRVSLARNCFTDGALYLDQMKSMRRRIAGYAYIARFVGLLDTIAQEDYWLRPAYPEFKRVGRGLRMGGYIAVYAFRRGNL